MTLSTGCLVAKTSWSPNRAVPKEGIERHWGQWRKKGQQALSLERALGCGRGHRLQLNGGSYIVDVSGLLGKPLHGTKLQRGLSKVFVSGTVLKFCFSAAFPGHYRIRTAKATRADLQPTVCELPTSQLRDHQKAIDACMQHILMTHIYIYIYTHVYVVMYIYTHMLCMCICMCIYTYTYIFACI